MNSIIQLLRPWQWYKNFVILLALIFSNNLFTREFYLPLFLGFVLLCLTSSANYVLNDLIDRKEDRFNKEKKNRPLASGKVGVERAVVLIVILLALSISGSFLLSTGFGILATLLFTLTTIYSTSLKKEAYADILFIASNFVLRAVAGALIIDVEISTWLIVGTFFFALFLATGKRRGEVLMLHQKASTHRKTLSAYTEHTTRYLMIISTSLLIMSYSIYSTVHNTSLMLGLPFLLYTIFRYFSLVEEGHAIARHPHLVIRDKRIVLASLLFLFVSFVSLYLL